MGESTGTQAIARAALIVRTVARHADGARLTDLALSTGLSAPTVRRILRCLIDEGMVLQSSATRRYQLGPLFAELGLNTSSYRTRATRSQRALERIASETECSVHLTMRSGFETVSIGRAVSGGPIRIATVDVGDRFPIGVGPAGVSMLAALDRDEVEAIIEVVAPSLPSYLGFDADSLRAEVEFARKHKYAICRERIVPGVSSIGVLLPPVEGWPPLALSTASITESITGPRRDSVVKQLRTAVREVAEILSTS
jgi:DNA-binding IclR family transcriptional regulator